MALAIARSVWGGRGWSGRRVAGPGGAGGEVHDPHPGRLLPLLQHAGEEHRVHLGHVVAPQHEDVGVVDVLVAPHGLVHAEGGHEAGHGAGHAEPGVRLHVVGAEPALEELRGDVAVGDRPLPGAVDGHAVLAVVAMVSRSCWPPPGPAPRPMGTSTSASVPPHHGPGQAVPSVEGLHRVVALHAGSPRFTGDSGSPRTATALPFSIPTRRPHPTPQKRRSPRQEAPSRTAARPPPGPQKGGGCPGRPWPPAFLRSVAFRPPRGWRYRSPGGAPHPGPDGPPRSRGAPPASRPAPPRRPPGESRGSCRSACARGPPEVVDGSHARGNGSAP
jgi:hypothetical protein